MLHIENLGVYNMENAIRGMRNSYNSWEKSDSRWELVPNALIDFKPEEVFIIGEEDLKLAKKLSKSGDSHSKFLRQIFVCMDITAPLYWWKHMDQYKVSTTTNSCSTMHSVIYNREFVLDDFSHEHLMDYGSGELVYGDWVPLHVLEHVIHVLNKQREKWLENNDKKYWWQMIQLLPSSYNQTRTWSGSYANLVNIIEQRRGHRLDEWTTFTEFVMENCPYLEEIIDYRMEKEQKEIMGIE